MNTLTLSGWAQPHDALTAHIPGSIAFDYSDYPSPTASFEGLQHYADIPYIIGWSMGGQLALRAIAAGVLKPKHLTIIGTPWQFVGDDGMDAHTYALFRDTYIKNPARHKERFPALLAKGDRNAREIIRAITHHPDVDNTHRWLPWLEELSRYSFTEDAHAILPPTLVIHGTQDAIVPVAQARMFAQTLPMVHIALWEAVGHTPHLHDPQRLLKEIMRHREHTKVVA